MTITELRPKPSTLVSVQVEMTYITEKHDCCDLDEFEPDDCVGCIGCGHAECRHQIDDISSSPCDVTGCDCGRMRCGDECQDCDGHGYHEDERSGRTYTCRICGGDGVIA